jgi:hypothetical protein
MTTNEYIDARVKARAADEAAYSQRTAPPAVIAAVAETPAPTPVPETVNSDFMDVITAALGSGGLKSRRFWLAVATFCAVLVLYITGNVSAGATLGDLIKTLGVYAAAEASTDIARAASASIAAGKSKGP